MASNGDSTYSDSTFGFIDISKYFSDSTVTSERYNFDMDLIRRYENENPRIPMKVFRGVKIKVRTFKSKPSRNVRNIKSFTGHSFKVGNSKK